MNEQPRALTPSWLPEAHRALLGLGLSPEWPEESVSAPGSRSRKAAELALKLLAELGLRPDRLLPALDGGVSLAFLAGDRCAEIEFLHSGEVVASCAGGRPVVARAWPVGSDLTGTLRAIHAFLRG